MSNTKAPPTSTFQNILSGIGLIVVICCLSSSFSSATAKPMQTIPSQIVSVFPSLAPALAPFSAPAPTPVSPSPMPSPAPSPTQMNL